tara:strand:+ start:334 stop:579 length:246 start_codon:yes stop_codon:yes gene_type:complete
MKIIAFENDFDDSRLEAVADIEEDGVKISIQDNSKTKKISTSIMLEYDDLCDFITSLNEFKVRLDEQDEEEEEEINQNTEE